jgi:signal peptidase I
VVDVARSGNSRDNEDEGDGPADQDNPGASSEVVGNRRKGRKKQRSFWKELPILIGVALLLTLLIQTFLARVFVIPSESMEQTLHGCPGCYGDRVLVDKLVYTFGDPEPGEVVVFERPDTWNQSEFSANRSSNGFVSWLQDVGAKFGLASPNEDDVVKRIVAVGGQTVQCCDEQGRVMVDGKPLDEPYIFWQNGRPDDQQRFDPIKVPAGMLWVLGDNRTNSCDSRCQGGGGTNGFVPVDKVIGKVRYIVLPPSRWRGVGDHNPQVSTATALVGTAVQYAPLGVGIAAAFPTLWLGRRVRRAIRSGGAGT